MMDKIHSHQKYTNFTGSNEVMLKPRRKKEEKVKVNKDSLKNAMKLFAYLKPYRMIFGIGWVFLILSSSIGLLFPLLMGQLLGSGSQSSDLKESLKNLSLENVNDVAMALLIVFAAQAVFSFFRVVIFTNVTENALRDIRRDAFSKLIYMPMDFFNENKVGELMSRISSDISQVQETLRTTVAEFFRQIVIIIGGTVLLFYLSWKLSLIMFATVPVMAVIAVIFGRFIRRLSKQAQDDTATSNAVIEESLSGISNVKSFTNEAFMLSRYMKSIESIRKINIRSGLWRGLFVSFIIFCLFGAIVFIVWQGVLMTQGVNPELTMDKLTTIILYTIMMGASFGSIPDLYASIQKAIGATENLMDIMSKESEQNLHHGESKPEIRGNVSFRDVQFAYPQRPDVNVLQGISFDTNENETVALVGSSGAGKTTIASLLLNYYQINSGQINYEGVGIEEIDLEHLRSRIAIVPQEVVLFAGTIRDNIAYGKKEASEDEINEAARKANAIEFINNFPDGLNTEVGDRGIQLSGGQKQRIAIARAILKNPVLLILDEATSALDSESENLVQEALEKLMEGRTSIVIAHRLSTIKKADKILVFENGQIVESGKHEELISKEGRYSRLVELQAMEN